MRTPRRSWVCGVPGAEVTRQKCCIGEPLYWYVDREIDIVDTVSNDLTGTTAMTPPAGVSPDGWPVLMPVRAKIDHPLAGRRRMSDE